MKVGLTVTIQKQINVCAVPDIQRELQVVPNGTKENDFHGAFEAWEK